jgi:predicted GNAT superfamily acetyltransferase
MIHKFILLLALIGFSGCFNERGVSLRYYNDCEEYYDSQGYYHKQCDKNIADYSDAKEVYHDIKDALSPESSSKDAGKVW